MQRLPSNIASINRRTVLAALAAACMPTRAGAQAASPLRGLLGMAAAEVVASDTTEIFRFIDVAALRALGGDGAGERTVLTWPQGYLDAMAAARSWPAMLGFAHDDVAQLLLVGGDTARAQQFLAGRFGAPAIEAALRRRGFAAVAVDGATVWRRRNDDDADLANSEPADPFGGAQGRPARLALLGGRLAFATTDTGIALAVAAATQRANTMLDYDEVSVLVGAAEADLGDGGTLVQAVLRVVAPLTDPHDALMRIAEEPEIARLPAVEDRRRAALGRPPFPLLAAHPLPPAALLLLGERRSAAGSAAFIALTYDEEATARAAAPALAARIAGYFSLGDPARRNLVANAGGAVAPKVVATPEGYAAMAVATAPGTLAGAAASPFAQWLLDVDRRAFWPLWML
jgi:hypothetical protein